MGMTIGQGLILGARNYIDAQERERQRKWEDELRQRQRKQWTDTDEAMRRQQAIRPAGTYTDQVPTYEGMTGGLDAQDIPTRAQTTTVTPLQEMEARAAAARGSADPEMMRYGMGLIPQVEQMREADYQRNERTKANEFVKQYSDMNSMLLEGINGVKSGAIAPEVFLRSLAQVLGYKTANSLFVSGLPGKAQYMVTDSEGKGTFAPITMEDALKLGETASEYLRAQMENALRGVSAEHYFKSEARGLDRQRVGATVMTAEAAKRNADSAARTVAVAEGMAPTERQLKEALAGKYDAEAEYARAGKGAINDEKIAKAERQNQINAATKEYEITRGQLVQGKDLNGKPLTPEARAQLHQQMLAIGDRILLLQGKDPKEDRNLDAYQKWLAEYTKTTGTMPTENMKIAMRTEFGLPAEDPIMDAIRRAGGLSGAPAGGAAGNKPAVTPEAAQSNARAQALAAMGTYTDAELEGIIRAGGMRKAFAQQELDYRRANGIVRTAPPRAAVPDWRLPPSQQGR